MKGCVIFLALIMFMGLGNWRKESVRKSFLNVPRLYKNKNMNDRREKSIIILDLSGAISSITVDEI
jgi:hypothetical protein